MLVRMARLAVDDSIHSCIYYLIVLVGCFKMHLFVRARLLLLIEVARVLLDVRVVGENLIANVVVREWHLQRALVKVILPAQYGLLEVLHLLSPIKV